MQRNPQSAEPRKPIGPVAATMWAAVLFFFGVGMAMYPSREFMFGHLDEFEGILLFLIWSRPTGILAIGLGLWCGWLVIDSSEVRRPHRLIGAAFASAFGAFLGRIGFSGEGFSTSALQGAAWVSLLAFAGVLVSRITLFPLFAAVVRLWKRGRRSDSSTEGGT